MGLPFVLPAPARRPPAGSPVAAFTVDVEDWYQSCVDYDAPISDRVVRNVDRLLAVIDGCGVKGTFFVQGRVAEAFPGLVASLAAQGHEIASHGYSHRPLHRMNDRELRTELERAKKTVEDAAGVAVRAFRAQDFSIGGSNMWAFEALAEAGFEVDSSIFPMRSRHYGVRGWPAEPHTLVLPSGRTLLEVPVAVWKTRRLRVPVAGGGYFRLLPQALLLRGILSVLGDARPAVVYCHPYEFDAAELREYRGELPWRTRAPQQAGRRWFPARVEALLASVRFGRFDEVLAAWGLR